MPAAQNDAFPTCHNEWHTGSSSARDIGAPCPKCGAIDAGAPIEVAELRTEAINFGEVDRFGRHVGVKILTWEGTCGGVTSFWGRAQATRNGQEYGASQPNRWFPTAAKRTQWLDRYIAGAKQRAQARQVK